MVAGIGAFEICVTKLKFGDVALHCGYRLKEGSHRFTVRLADGFLFHVPLALGGTLWNGSREFPWPFSRRWLDCPLLACAHSSTT